MPQSMNIRQARVVDPILTVHARGYTNAEFIGHLLFPIVPIGSRTGKILKFGKECFRRMSTRRAPGSETKRVQFGYDAGPLALIQDALEALVADEIVDEAQKGPSIDLAQQHVNQVLDIFALGREMACAALARDPKNYGANNKMMLAASDKWSDPASDPAKHVRAAKEQIRSMIGRYPNVLTLGPSVFNALCEHPRIQDRFKYTSAESITTDMLAGYFDLEQVIVGRGVYLPENASDDMPAQDIWGDDAFLTYRAQAGAYLTPSYGYTYRLKGSPTVEKPYRDNNRKSTVYPVSEEWQAVIAGADAGFLFQNPAGA